MKNFKDIKNNSTIAFAFVNSVVPSPEYAPLIEEAKAHDAFVFVPSGSKKLFEAVYKDVSYEETDLESSLDIAGTLSGFYNTIVVLDSPRKADLYESVSGIDFEPVEYDIPLKSKAQVALESKNFRQFSSLFEDTDSVELRKIYNKFNPAATYSDFVKQTSEAREQFYTGETFSVGSRVLSENTVYEIIDRGSNYLVVVDSKGNTSRKFTENLEETSAPVIFEDFSYFKGFTPSDSFFEYQEIKEAFDKTIDAYNKKEISDAFAILKSIKAVDSYILGEDVDVNTIQYSLSKIGQLHYHTYLNEMKSDAASLMQAAGIIAGAVGSKTDGKTPSEIVNNAIIAAKKKSTPEQMKILKNMLSTASKIGLKYDSSLLESVDDRMLAVHKHQKLLKEKPTTEVLKAHQDLRKIGVDYSARDVGGKRAMVRDILDHNYGPRDVTSYKKLSADIRRSMSEDAQPIDEISKGTVDSYVGKAMRDTISGKKDRNKGMSKAFSRLAGTDKPLLDPKKKYVGETTAYGNGRSIEHDYANNGATKVPKYNLVSRSTKKIVSTHSSATDAVSARTKIKGSADTHAIVKEDSDPMSYDSLKAKIGMLKTAEHHAKEEHTKPGFSMNASTDTVRKMKVQKLKDS